MPYKGLERWQYKGSWQTRVKGGGHMPSKSRLDMSSGKEKRATQLRWFGISDLLLSIQIANRSWSHIQTNLPTRFGTLIRSSLLTLFFISQSKPLFLHLLHLSACKSLQDFWNLDSFFSCNENFKARVFSFEQSRYWS